MKTLLHRFLAKVEPMPTSEGCIEWTGSPLGSRRYGQIYAHGKTRAAHRVSWQLFVGLIPTGLWVLHKCDNPRCVNSEHLFLGTRTDNVRDAVTKRRHWQSKKVTCKNGHEFNDANTLARNGRNGRDCRECRNRRNRELRSRKRLP